MRLCRVLRMAASTPSMQGVAGGRARPAVYITRNIPPEGRRLLEDGGCAVTQWQSDDAVPRDVLMKNVQGMSALFCLLTDKVDEALLAQAGPALKTVCTMSVGYEHIDLHACSRRRLRVGYTPDVLTAATAELTIALLLAVSRRLAEGASAVRTGEWGTWKPLWLCGSGLHGRTVGIVGLGRIGQAVAHRVASFGVARIVHCGSGESAASRQQPPTTTIGGVRAERVPLDELLAQSDFVVACCRLTPATACLFNAATFRKMKPSAIFVNTSRGGIVDQDALYEALASGTIRAAGLDVTTPEPLPVESRLLKLSNCLILPHIGSATIEARTAMAELTARNILAALSDSDMPAEVQLPAAAAAAASTA